MGTNICVEILAIPERWEPQHDNHAGRGLMTADLLTGLGDADLFHLEFALRLVLKGVLTDHPEESDGA